MVCAPARRDNPRAVARNNYFTLPSTTKDKSFRYFAIPNTDGHVRYYHLNHANVPEQYSSVAVISNLVGHYMIRLSSTHVFLGSLEEH